MYIVYVQRVCTEHIYIAYVHTLCTKLNVEVLQQCFSKRITWITGDIRLQSIRPSILLFQYGESLPCSSATIGIRTKCLNTSSTGFRTTLVQHGLQYYWMASLTLAFPQ